MEKKNWRQTARSCLCTSCCILIGFYLRTLWVQYSSRQVTLLLMLPGQGSGPYGAWLKLGSDYMYRKKYIVRLPPASSCSLCRQPDFLLLWEVRALGELAAIAQQPLLDAVPLAQVEAHVVEPLQVLEKWKQDSLQVLVYRVSREGKHWHSIGGLRQE
mmetsp:Transcript_1701/g.4909  ORF Transcript_1701/g.4909 Transcript_1701/m.4909 type:complete len:158 (+) Transcript_1701:163-636(+)